MDNEHLPILFASMWRSLALHLIVLVAGCTLTSTQELLDANFLAKGQAPIDLLAPTQDAQVVTANPTFSWSSRGVSLYNLQVATDSEFKAIVIDKDVSGVSYTVINSDLIGVSSLTTNTYYWRVKIPRLSTNLQSKPGSFLLVAIPASGYAGALYVNATASGTQIGSAEKPFKQIGTAIQAAQALRQGEPRVSFDIRIAEGSYVEEIIMLPGISIRGGFRGGSWDRDVASYVTSITGLNEVAIKCYSNVTTDYRSTTVIDGMNVTSGSSALLDLIGISLINCNATIANNVISGGNSPTRKTMAISAVGTSSSILRNNNINGGSSTDTSYGLLITIASGWEIVGNNISAGSGTGTKIGLQIQSDSNTLIYNNIIQGGTNGVLTTGLSVTGASTLVRGNTVTSGSGSVVTVTYSIGATSSPHIENNQIVSLGAGTRRGIQEGGTGAGGDPILLNNNNFFDMGSGGTYVAYLDENTTNYAGICNDGKPGAGGACIGNNVSTNAPSGNIAISNVTNQFFVNAAANDFRLIAPTAATCNVFFGGLNLSSSFTTDYASTTRTANTTGLPCTLTAPSSTTGQGWSIGAYERD